MPELGALAATGIFSCLHRIWEQRVGDVPAEHAPHAKGATSLTSGD